MFLWAHVLQFVFCCSGHSTCRTASAKAAAGNTGRTSTALLPEPFWPMTKFMFLPSVICKIAGRKQPRRGKAPRLMRQGAGRGEHAENPVLSPCPYTPRRQASSSVRTLGKEEGVGDAGGGRGLLRPRVPNPRPQGRARAPMARGGCSSKRAGTYRHFVVAHELRRPCVDGVVVADADASRHEMMVKAAGGWWQQQTSGGVQTHERGTLRGAQLRARRATQLGCAPDG